MLKQGLNHAKLRIRDAWKRWVLKQGLNYVKSRSGKQGWVLEQGLNHAKSRVREAAAQAHPESLPRPKTYS